ncbi:MAG: hypothetical protein HYX35_05685 [Proteobacteria bacterium]|nr:hypothetical protein [Pseudomonadota bacterium]
MKNNIFKNFLSAASIAVISLLTTISPSSVRAMDENKIEKESKKKASLDFLQDWVGLGLVKTNAMEVKEGDKLTVTLTFDDVTEPTALSFLNSAQNGYYEGGIVVQPGTKKVTLTSIVPKGETQTWLTIRNPGFDGNTLLPLGLTLNQASLTVERAAPLDVAKAAPLDLLQDWVGLGLVKTNPMDVTEGDKLTVALTFDEVTAPTALSFLNSAQNG